MDKADLAIKLSRLETFSNPDPSLEQYPTPPDVAADMVHRLALEQQDGTVIDLGTGTGMLAIGAALAGFKVKGYDTDTEALEIARTNKEQIEQDHEIDVSFEHADIGEIDAQSDAVIMNPPFGIQERDTNTAFLETAFETAPLTYALLHQSPSKPAETRKFIKEYAVHRQHEARILTTYELDLPRSMSFHQEDTHTIRADLYRFTR